MLIPAIDLKDGAVVQLVQGERLAIKDEDVFRWVRRFEKFPKVQVIDLDAAMGIGDNLALVPDRRRALAASAAASAQPARRTSSAGAQQIIAGSSLFRNGAPDLAFAESLRDAVGRERVIAAVDSRGGHVVIHGWKTVLPLTAVEAVRALEPYCDEFLYTHVDTEGLMGGTNIGAIRAVRDATTRRLTAAGGITTQKEIDDLHALGVDSVVGMAIYTGTLNFELKTENQKLRTFARGSVKGRMRSFAVAFAICALATLAFAAPSAFDETEHVTRRCSSSPAARCG